MLIQLLDNLPNGVNNINNNITSLVVEPHSSLLHVLGQMQKEEHATRGNWLVELGDDGENADNKASILQIL